MIHVTIYHNPKCSKSCATLAAIRARGIEPQIVYYLETPPDEATLRQLITDSGVSVLEAMRSSENIGHQAPALSDDERIRLMLTEPTLIQRPFVVTPWGTRLCRPPSLLDEILPSTDDALG